ncbi:MAG: sensor domain-containing diguanylate cyclase [Gammaproteobacteria bacterium]|nr:sensor domain-containing diguanylate cyclase [Gammaproteobacteria bacterium]MCW8909885.1 sensor domain-containing diguanylate cyclase [Gammaproteobacteria bacterium]MCW9005705.1 sensor domain-containing diguanylate cyclase [Gammaproteobacteria bacterium]
MKSFNYSIRFIITLTIIFMGIQGLILSLLSSDIHREHAISNHKSTIEKLVKIRTDQILINLTDKARELGLSQQQEPVFKQALKNKDIKTLEKIMNSHFHRYFVTAGILKLEKILVLNKDFSLLAESTEGNTSLVQYDIACPRIIDRAQQAKGPDRLKIKSGVCENREKTYHMVITPIGGLILKGYIVIITDPVNNLLAMENDFGMAMKFMYDNGTSIYKSDNWDIIKNDNNFLLTDYHLSTNFGKTSLHIETIENIKPLYNKMPHTRILVMASASLITFIAIIISLIIIHKTTLKPLNQMSKLLLSIRNDKNMLGQMIEVKGTTEIRELAISFNDMSSQLDELYMRMEDMAYTDQLTDLPNRHLFNNKLHKIIRGLQFTGNNFALLMMDLNKFKPINDTYGHKVGDKVLQEVGKRLKNVLRTSDSLLRIDKDGINEEKEGTVARLGGDEFAAILTGIDNSNNAKIVAEKIIYAMREPFMIDDYKLNVGISIGIALYPHDANNDDDLLHNADTAMYNAKSNHKHYSFYKKDNVAINQ